MYVVNEAAIIAEELKLRMDELVKKGSISTSRRSNKSNQKKMAEEYV